MGAKKSISIVSWQFVVVVASSVIAFVLYLPYSPAAIQKREMDKAERFFAPVRAKLQEDPRFHDLSGGVVTNITISVDCGVNDATDFNASVSIIDEARSHTDEVCPIIIQVGLEKPTPNSEYRLQKIFEAKKPN